MILFLLYFVLREFNMQEFQKRGSKKGGSKTLQLEFRVGVSWGSFFVAEVFFYRSFLLNSKTMEKKYTFRNSHKNLSKLADKKKCDLNRLFEQKRGENQIFPGRVFTRLVWTKIQTPTFLQKKKNSIFFFFQKCRGLNFSKPDLDQLIAWLGSFHHWSKSSLEKIILHVIHVEWFWNVFLVFFFCTFFRKLSDCRSVSAVILYVYPPTNLIIW